VTADIEVTKFGGSSLATLAQARDIAQIIGGSHRAGRQIVVVVSARGSTTDDLLSVVRGLSGTPDRREADQLLATGEIASAAILALVLREHGVPAVSLTAAQAGIEAAGEHGAGAISRIHTTRIRSLLSRGYVPVVTGFQGVRDNGDVVTLGRGGSDTTAVALTAALAQGRCSIFTDVDGVHDADPRIVPSARRLPSVEAGLVAELAFAGAKVVHAGAAGLAAASSVDLHVAASSGDGSGTAVHAGVEVIPPADEVTAVACDTGAALVHVHCGPAGAGAAQQVFALLGGLPVQIDSIAQATACGCGPVIAITMRAGEAGKLRAALAPLALRVEVAEDLAKVSVVGRNLLTGTGHVAAAMAALARAGIGVAAVSTSQQRLSVLVPRDQAERAVAVLHAELLPAPPRDRARGRQEAPGSRRDGGLESPETAGGPGRRMKIGEMA
jgi:aspartate kinase